MKIKFLKRERSFKKGGLVSNPDFFWAILLSLAFCLIVASFIFGFFLFQKINNSIFLEDSLNDVKIDHTNQIKLNKVLEYFSNRQNKSVEILNSPSPIVDPSL